jgi:hypothetical protein
MSGNRSAQRLRGRPAIAIVAYELLAALSLAKLYQSTARPVEAHAVLAPALEGFSPTPEMPEIVEAQGRRRCWSVWRRAASSGERPSAERRERAG